MVQYIFKISVKVLIIGRLVWSHNQATHCVCCLYFELIREKETKKTDFIILYNICEAARILIEKERRVILLDIYKMQLNDIGFSLSLSLCMLHNEIDFFILCVQRNNYKFCQK